MNACDQLSIDFIHTRARRTDGETSREAAKAAASPKADMERKAIIAAVKTSFLGLTARQAAMITGIDYIEVQRRISECGLVKTKKRRDGCYVWEAAGA